MNKVILVGRIGKDPETYTFKNGDKKVSFPLATSEKYKKDGEWKETTEWHNVVLYRETKLRKGDLIEVEGKITTRSWDSPDGGKRYITEIIARTAGLLSRKETQASTPVNSEPESEDETDGLPF